MYCWFCETIIQNSVINIENENIVLPYLSNLNFLRFLLKKILRKTFKAFYLFEFSFFLIFNICHQNDTMQTTNDLSKHIFLPQIG